MFIRVIMQFLIKSLKSISVIYKSYYVQHYQILHEHFQNVSDTYSNIKRLRFTGSL